MSRAMPFLPLLLLRRLSPPRALPTAAAPAAEADTPTREIRMPDLPLSPGESLAIGAHIRLHLTSHWQQRWHLFVEATWEQCLEVAHGYRASAPCDFGWNAHVLVLADGDYADIGPVRLCLRDARPAAEPAHALRAAWVCIDAPPGMGIRRLPRPSVLARRRKATGGACWS